MKEEIPPLRPSAQSACGSRHFCRKRSMCHRSHSTIHR